MSSPAGGPPGRAKPPRVVAELGRPETPAETADRKAEASRKRRANQTARNLGLSLAASLLIVLVLVLVVARPDTDLTETVDHRAVAQQAQASLDVPLVEPDVPDDWSANAAEVRRGGADGVPAWYVGFVTPERQFVGYLQGVDANPTWLSQQVEQALVTSTVAIGGLTWDVRDRREADATGNHAYSLTTTLGRSTFVLFGTADDAEFRTIAEAVAAEAQAEQETP
ncbi:DUF4245 domain-containing protein [Frigoribacterium salinisoli]